MWAWADWTALGRVADVASLVAAAASVIAVLKIGALKRRLLDNARLDPLVRTIRASLDEVRGLAADYPASRVALETQIRRCVALTRRYERGLPKDVVGKVARLKELEKELDGLHTAVEQDGVSDRRLLLFEDMAIELDIVAALVEETLARRQIGGEDA